ncbi:MAG TPA: hypothetical protein VNC19_03270 [Gemmatimonadales bacterium]|jgi:hypothetical protein|nr:hypothetical protein [Gemmatimonadales bacterium]
MGSLLFVRRRLIAIATVAALGCGGSELTLPDDGTGGPGANPSPPSASSPGRIAPVEGGSQAAVTGEDVPISPAVRVVDSLGQPIGGYEVTFVVTGGGGTLLEPSQVTGPDGIARVGRWTLGSPGLNTVEARAESLTGSPVVFEATALSRGDVDHFVFVVQPDGVRVNKAQTIQVAMVDAAGNVVPLSGIEIYLGLFKRQNNGEYGVRNKVLRGDRFADTENGVATFHLALSEVGTYQFRALSDELPEVGPQGPEPFLFSRPFNVY